MKNIWYHAGCWDGFCAAWLCRNVWPAANYVPVQYGNPAPYTNGKPTLIVDFSYPRDVLLEMREHCDLTVLDHHKTAKDELADLDFCVFDMDSPVPG